MKDSNEICSVKYTKKRLFLMVRRFLKHACWMIALCTFILSFFMKGSIDSSFYRSISMVSLLTTLVIHKKDNEVKVNVNHTIKANPQFRRANSMDVNSSVKNFSDSGIRFG